MSLEPSTPLTCDEHGEPISGTCSRCGRFVCARCTPSRADLEGATCASCQAKLELRLARPGIDLLVIRSLGDLLLHAPLVLFVVGTRAELGLGRARLGLVLAAEVFALGTALRATVLAIGARRRAIAAIGTHQVISVVALVSSGVLIAAARSRFGLVLALTGATAYALLAALPTLLYLRLSREPRRHFVR